MSVITTMAVYCNPQRKMQPEAPRKNTMPPSLRLTCVDIHSSSILGRSVSISSPSSPVVVAPSLLVPSRSPAIVPFPIPDPPLPLLSSPLPRPPLAASPPPPSSSSSSSSSAGAPPPSPVASDSKSELVDSPVSDLPLCCRDGDDDGDDGNDNVAPSTRTRPPPPDDDEDDDVVVIAIPSRVSRRRIDALIIARRRSMYLSTDRAK